MCFFYSIALVKCHDCSNFLCTDCREPHLRETFYNISSSVSQLRRTLPKLSDKIASYEQRVNSVKTNYEQVRREITSAIATLIDELKHREAALLTEAEVYMQSQLRYIK
jgi:chromosome segregation ATPase